VKRNPRVNPIPGDVLRGINRRHTIEDRTVKVVSSAGWVQYSAKRKCWLSSDGWKKWAAGAILLKHGRERISADKYTEENGAK
jgi:hypothetical protein